MGKRKREPPPLAVGLLLYRGLRIGWIDNRPMPTVWAEDEVESFVVRHVRRNEIGHHWTPNRRMADEFALGLAEAGHSQTLRKAKYYPDKLFVGVTVAGTVKVVGNVPYSGQNVIAPYQYEQEVTLPGNTVVEITEAALIVMDPETGDEVSGGTVKVEWLVKV